MNNNCPYLSKICSCSSMEPIRYPFNPFVKQKRPVSISVFDILQIALLLFLVLWFFLIFFFSFVEECPFFSKAEIRPRTIHIPESDIRALLSGKFDYHRNKRQPNPPSIVRDEENEENDSDSDSGSDSDDSTEGSDIDIEVIKPKVSENKDKDKNEQEDSSKKE